MSELFERDLWTHLSGYGPLTAHVSGRIYPHTLPQSPTLPAIVFDTVSKERDRVHADTHGNTVNGMVAATYRFRLWAETYSAGIQAFAELINSFNGFAHQTMGATTVEEAVVQTEASVFEPDLRQYFFWALVEITYHE